MKKEVGLWIDHRQAVIVTFKDGIAVKRDMVENMEKQVPSSSNAEDNLSPGAPGPGAENLQDQKFYDYQDRYYDSIILLIRDAQSIWIFGPGEAKAELEDRLKQANLGARIVGIYTIDKMTTPQIISRVRAPYLL